MSSLRNRRKALLTRPAGPPRLNRDSPQARGLVFWMPVYGGDSTTAPRDFSDYSQPITLNNGTITKINTAEGPAFSFSAVHLQSDRAQIPSASGQPFTICARVKTSTTGYGIISFGPATNFNGPHFRSDNVGGVAGYFFAVWGDGTIQGASNDPTGVNDAVAVYDGTNGYIYENGILIGGPTAFTYNGASTTDLNIGTINNNGNDSSLTVNYDYRLYDRAWSAEEVRAFTNPTTRWDLYWRPKTIVPGWVVETGGMIGPLAGEGGLAGLGGLAGARGGLAG